MLIGCSIGRFPLGVYIIIQHSVCILICHLHYSEIFLQDKNDRFFNSVRIYVQFLACRTYANTAYHQGFSSLAKQLLFLQRFLNCKHPLSKNYTEQNTYPHFCFWPIENKLIVANSNIMTNIPLKWLFNTTKAVYMHARTAVALNSHYLKLNYSLHWSLQLVHGSQNPSKSCLSPPSVSSKAMAS